ncbi:MAG: HlyD family secretion protein [Bacillota bacterium]
MPLSPKRRVLLVATAALATAAIGVSVAYAAWHIFGGKDTALTLSGNIEAHESVLSFNEVQSRIVVLPFDEGKTVTAGMVLAKVDDAVYRQQVEIARAALEMQERQKAAAAQNLVACRKTVDSDEADLAQKSLDAERTQSLWSQHFIDTSTRDQAATALKQSQAGLERDRALVGVAERNLELAEAGARSADQNLKQAQLVEGYTALAAPYDGVILVRQAELGEVVAPGTPIFTLADLDHVWLRAYLNETYLSRVRLGQAVTLTTDSYPDKKYSGRISFISSSAEFTPKSVETHEERVTLVYRIRIDVDNPTHELLPGMPADAHINLSPGG